MAAGERFVRRLRVARGGQPFAYLLVGEQHKDGHWHLHLALPFQVPRARLLVMWGHGRVDEGFSPDTRKKLRSYEEQAALAGSYCGKYLGKSLAVLGDQAANRQTYRVAEGFEPREVLALALNEAEAFRIVRELCGGEPAQVSWSSADSDDWQGPACWWFRFGWPPTQA